MSVATRFIDDQLTRVTPAAAERLYQFDESPLLARRAARNPMRAATHGASRWRSSVPRAFTSRTSKGGASSIVWQARARWHWGTTIR